MELAPKTGGWYFASIGSSLHKMALVPQDRSLRHSLVQRLQRAARARLGGLGLYATGNDDSAAAGNWAAVGNRELLRGKNKNGADAKEEIGGDISGRMRSDATSAGLFAGGALEPFISSALNNSVGPPRERAREACTLFNRTFDSISQLCESRDDSNKNSKDLHLSGAHAIGPRTMVDVSLHAARQQLTELRLKLTHGRLGLFSAGSNLAGCGNQISAMVVSDLRKRHRIALESSFGEETNDDHAVSAIVGSDFKTRASWGIASSHRWRKRKATLFFRFSSEEYSGNRIILQSVHKLSNRNTVSPICAVTIGSPPQAGVSWTRLFGTNDGLKVADDSFQLKALTSADGVFALNLHVKIGEID